MFVMRRLVTELKKRKRNLALLLAWAMDRAGQDGKRDLMTKNGAL